MKAKSCALTSLLFHPSAPSSVFSCLVTCTRDAPESAVFLLCICETQGPFLLFPGDVLRLHNPLSGSHLSLALDQQINSQNQIWKTDCFRKVIYLMLQQPYPQMKWFGKCVKAHGVAIIVKVNIDKSHKTNLPRSTEGLNKHEGTKRMIASELYKSIKSIRKATPLLGSFKYYSLIFCAKYLNFLHIWFHTQPPTIAVTQTDIEF